MKRSILKDKSKAFALRIVKLYNVLSKDRNEFVMSKQLLRCGTSIGANVAEAFYAESESDFIHKLAISQKECSETLYWLELLRDSEIISPQEFISVNANAEELMKLLTASIKTVKKRLSLNN